MDKWLAAVAAIILILCALLLLDDLKVIELNITTKKQNSGISVGRIKHFQNDVKRRSSDDILWSRSQQDEELYIYDSILTLSDSQAVLELFGNSKIELSENTLIVIEPSPSGKDNQIRLRFKRGSIGSRSLNGKAEIASEDWEITLDTASEFNIRRTDLESVEVEVKSGQAIVRRGDSTQTVTKDNALVLKSDKAETVQINPELKWKEQERLRLYAHGNKADRTLSWAGPAKTIEVSQTDGNKKILPVENLPFQTNQEFESGLYFLRLSDGIKYSPLLRVEVNRAPTIHLYYPLPRDRVITKSETTFSWKRVPIATRFRLDIARDRGFTEIQSSFETEKTNLKINFEELGRFYWRVVGFDSDGFEIPAPYSNEIFFVEDPFEAPGMNGPREPSGAFLFRLPLPIKMWFSLIDSAFARPKKKNNVEFGWRSVKGSDGYWLEIDDDPYFQSPEIMERVRKNSFVWKNAPKKLVYWRVAADSKGRMGLFSPVQKADLSSLSNRKPAGDFTVMVLKERQELAEPPPPPVIDTPLDPAPNEPPPEPVVETKPQEVPIKEDPLPPQWGYVWYGFGYSNRTMSNNTIDSVKVSSFDALNFGGAFETQISNTTFKIKHFLAWDQWKVKDKKTYAFQSEISDFEGSLSLLMDIKERRWFSGLKIKRALGIERKGYEEFGAAPEYFGGPTMEYVTHSGRWKILSQASLLIGDGGFGFDASGLARYSTPYLQGAFFGLQVDYEYSAAKTKNSLIRVTIPLGYEW